MARQTGVMTSAEVLQNVNISEKLLDVIIEIFSEVPELSYFGASPITKNSYLSLYVPMLPKVGFRKADEDRVLDSPELATRETKCAYLDASWALRCSVATASDWGEDMAKALQTKTHLQAAFMTLAAQTWYGNRNDPDGFVGLDALMTANGSPEMNLGGTANVSSVYAVRTGIESCQYAWGSNGQFTEGDVLKQWVGTKAKGAHFYVQQLATWVGFQVTSKWAAGRITGLSTTTGKTLNDGHLYKLYSSFPAGQKPTAWFMSARSIEQLRSSRQPVNEKGVPAPTPTEAVGLPIHETTAISDEEENLVVTPPPPEPEA